MKCSVFLLVCFLLICLTLTTNFVSADVDAAKLILKIHDSIIEGTSVGKYSVINDKNFPFIILNSSGDLCVDCKVNSTSFDWGIVFETSGNVSVGVDLPGLLNESQTKLVSCTERATYEQQQKSNCENKYSDLLKQNLSDYKTQYDLCKVDLRGKDTEISSRNDKISSLETEKKDTANKKYFWFAGGIVVGALGWMWHKGELGKGGVKDKSEDEFNRRQAG